MVQVWGPEESNASVNTRVSDVCDSLTFPKSGRLLMFTACKCTIGIQITKKSYAIDICFSEAVKIKDVIEKKEFSFHFIFDRWFLLVP